LERIFNMKCVETQLENFETRLNSVFVCNVLKRNYKRNLNSVSTSFILQLCLCGFNKNLTERVRTHCTMRRVETQLETISKRVRTQVFYTACLDATRRKNNRVSTRFWKTLNAFKRILFTNCVQTRLKYCFSHVGTYSYFRAHLYGFISCISDAILPKSCCSRKVNCVIEIIGLHRFYSSKLH